MEKMNNQKENKYPETELTRKIIGLAFSVYNKLGPGYPEKIYQQALASDFTESGLSFKKENYCRIIYNGLRIGYFYVDFVVEDKVVVELKARGDIYQKDIAQVLAYLKEKTIKVGIILFFGKSGIKIKRLVL